MKKLLVIVSFLFLLIGSVSAYGGRLNGQGCHNDHKENTYHCHDEAGNVISSTSLKDKKQEIKTIKVEAYEAIKANRDEAQENRMEFRDENSDEYKAIIAELSDEEKVELAELKADFQEELEALKEEAKNAESEEAKEELREKMKELHDAHMEELSELLGEAADELLEKRMDVHEENKELRAENKRTRAEFKAERKEYISSYRGAFVKRIGNRLDNIPAKNLEKALVKINAKIDKVEANENMADNAKESLMDALFALIEIVELKLEGIDGE